MLKKTALFSHVGFPKISIKLVNCAQTDQLDAAEQISCPHLLVEAEDGAKFDPEIFQQIVQVAKTHCVAGAMERTGQR